MLILIVSNYSYVNLSFDLASFAISLFEFTFDIFSGCKHLKTKGPKKCHYLLLFWGCPLAA